MLFALHIEVAQKLTGMSQASFFEHSTGISRMTHQRGRAYAVWQQRREEVQAHADSLLLRMMRSQNTTHVEMEELRAGLPSGISAQMIYFQGLLSEATPATRELIRMLDESDRRLCQLADADDGPGFAAEIGPESELGPDFCSMLYISGLTRLELEMAEADRHFLIRTLTRRAHMALSFLAAFDHEVGQRNMRVQGFDTFDGLPRFATLLIDPEAGAPQRLKPNDPIARLVDLVGAAGYRHRKGCWPETPQTIAELGIQTECSGAVGGEGSRFIRALRSGKSPMTRSSFHNLVSSQISEGKVDPELVKAVECRMEPYLMAAHLLTELMPPHKTAPGHLDRFGWRQAYLDTWARMAWRYPPVRRSKEQLPRWLCATPDGSRMAHGHPVPVC